MFSVFWAAYLATNSMASNMLGVPVQNDVQIVCSLIMCLLGKLRSVSSEEMGDSIA